METKTKKFIEENKWFIVFYLILVFIHILLLWNGNECKDDFWPFGDSDLCEYNFLELFVYLTLPLLYFVIKELIGDDIKKSLDE